ncbi:MAG: hypothetical protein HFI75_10730 [Lachnospiraceae bacterium]|nr:hypothetical protein [Lachnospiraceae bacterium]
MQKQPFQIRFEKKLFLQLVDIYQDKGIARMEYDQRHGKGLADFIQKQ